jgi:hypothetical protein
MKNQNFVQKVSALSDSKFREQIAKNKFSQNQLKFLQENCMLFCDEKQDIIMETVHDKKAIVEFLDKRYCFGLMPAFKWYESIKESNKSRLCQKSVSKSQLCDEEKPECPWKGFKLNPEIIDGYVF